MSKCIINELFILEFQYKFYKPTKKAKSSIKKVILKSRKGQGHMQRSLSHVLICHWWVTSVGLGLRNSHFSPKALGESWWLTRRLNCQLQHCLQGVIFIIAILQQIKQMKSNQIYRTILIWFVFFALYRSRSTNSFRFVNTHIQHKTKIPLIKMFSSTRFMISKVLAMWHFNKNTA